VSSRSTPQVSGLPRPAQRCSDQPAAVTIRGPNPCCFLPLESVLNIVQVLYFECWLVGKGCGCGRFRSFFRIFTLSSVGRYSQPGLGRRNLTCLWRHFADIASRGARQLKDAKERAQLSQVHEAKITPRAASPLTHLAEIKELRFCYRPCRRF